MVRHLVVLWCGVMLLCLGGLSCRKIDRTSTQPLLKIEPIKSAAAVPSEFGNLVSVTQRDPTSALLWFERPDKTVVVVGLRLDGDNVTLSERVALVPRSSP